MARPLRLEYAGALYHVTARGNGREDIYLSDEDREAWLRLLGQVCERFNWVCHAYCLMTNHYHLLIETPEGNLSAGMRQLNGVYTQAFNRTHARVGHVFQGRFKAILVDRDAYLFEVARYIVLNPVRAGMVADVEDWPWSSYPEMVGEAPALPWLNARGLLSMFSDRLGRARQKYIDFVREGVGLPSIWEGLRGQVYLGDDAFMACMQQLCEDQEDQTEVPRSQRRPMANELEDYAREVSTKEERNAGIISAWKTGDFTLLAIARVFGVHYTTVSKIVNEGT